MVVVHNLIIWSLFLFIIFTIIYLILNKKLKVKSIKNKVTKKRFNKRVDQKLMKWRNVVIPRKVVYHFLPLIPFFIIVYIFLTHMIYFAVITSDSMSPTFEKGDLVLMQSIDKSTKNNDIIIFNDKTEHGLHPPVIHRIENITDEGIITKGDATNLVDDWIVESDEVQGKVVSIFDNKPIVIKNVGNYFIEDNKINGHYENEFKFSSLLVTTLKDIGLAIFIGCVGLYIFLTFREMFNSN